VLADQALLLLGFEASCLYHPSSPSCSQAALQAVSSAEKMQLVEQLTGYVSDALAEVPIHSVQPARRMLTCESTSEVPTLLCRGHWPMKSCTMFFRQAISIQFIASAETHNTCLPSSFALAPAVDDTAGQSD